MTKEYIEREAALIQIGNADDTMDAEQRVWAIPAADVVQVVRCRECKHSIMYKFSYNYERVPVCNKPGVTIKAVKPMHFCADGKRKDGGQDE